MKSLWWLRTIVKFQQAYTKVLSFLLTLLMLSIARPCLSEEVIRIRILSKFHPQEVFIFDGDKKYEVKYEVKAAKDFQLDLSHLDGFDILLPEHKVRRSYYGGLSLKFDNQELVLVNNVKLEEYVAEVVLGELGIGPVAAMQAQAVLARSYATINRNPSKGYDLSDLAYHQVYPGKSIHSELSLQKIKSTKEQLLVWRGEVIQAVYHAECGSQVYSANEIWGKDKIPYLTSFPLDNSLKGKRWHQQLTFEELNQVFGVASGPFRMLVHKGVLGVKVGSDWLVIDEFRLKINRLLGWNRIPSNEFKIVNGHNGLNFHGRGRGHLVGLCQQQASQLAEQGWSYQQILALFYPGSKLSH